jgi:hypothetical protein
MIIRRSLRLPLIGCGLTAALGGFFVLKAREGAQRAAVT